MYGFFLVTNTTLFTASTINGNLKQFQAFSRAINKDIIVIDQSFNKYQIGLHGTYIPRLNIKNE
jgi:hypothetical protein